MPRTMGPVPARDPRLNQVSARAGWLSPRRPHLATQLDFLHKKRPCATNKERRKRQCRPINNRRAGPLFSLRRGVTRKLPKEDPGASRNARPCLCTYTTGKEEGTRITTSRSAQTSTSGLFSPFYAYAPPLRRSRRRRSPAGKERREGGPELFTILSDSCSADKQATREAQGPGSCTAAAAALAGLI